MRFDIITIFPEIIDAYVGESILKRAQQKKLVEFVVHDLRDYAKGRHRKVDDRPFGGGPGMVLQVEPLARALSSVIPARFAIAPARRVKAGVQKSRMKIILFSAAGKQFTQKMAVDWAKKYDRIVMIAGRYEGMDERIKTIIQNSKFKIQNLSIGPYVLTGGELPALIVADAVSRHIPGVLGTRESLEEKRYGIGVPVYTRPEIFEWRGKKYRVPGELLSGNHKKIEQWRKKMASKHVQSGKAI